jgi:hypothetical protein
MTYAQWDVLTDVHIRLNTKRSGRRVEDAVHGDIAALKEVTIASG